MWKSTPFFKDPMRDHIGHTNCPESLNFQGIPFFMENGTLKYGGGVFYGGQK